jgi:hypothetical protein
LKVKKAKSKFKIKETTGEPVTTPIIEAVVALMVRVIGEAVEALMAKLANGEVEVARMVKLVNGEAAKARMARLVNGEAVVAPTVKMEATTEVVDITIQTTGDLMAKLMISRLFKTLLSGSVEAMATIEEATVEIVVEEEATEEVILLSTRAS